ncbi:hypothetical protein ACN47E_009378 [Coniothyrium glycines]
MTRPRSTAVPLKPKVIVDRLPSISGWMTEHNVFRILSDVCKQGLQDQGERIGMIQAPDYSIYDGGLIFNPPGDFPLDIDPSAVWAWVHKNQQEHSMHIVPIDIKLNVSKRTASQTPPIFIITPPGHTDILCILPFNSFVTL